MMQYQEDLPRTAITMKRSLSDSCIAPIIAENKNKKRRRTTAQRRRRSICFESKPKVHVFEKDNVKENVWYSKEEYGSMRLESLLSVQCVRAAAMEGKYLCPNSNDFTFRGLEPFQSESTEEEAKSRRLAYKYVVLQEQVRQRLFGIQDPKQFHALTTEQSESALKRAQEKAAMDEHDAYKHAAAARSATDEHDDAVPLPTTELKKSVSMSAISNRPKSLQKLHAAQMAKEMEEMQLRAQLMLQIEVLKAQRALEQQQQQQQQQQKLGAASLALQNAILYGGMPSERVY